VKPPLWTGLSVGLFFAIAPPLPARKKSSHHASPPPQKPRAEQIEAATRLQIFLDRANFSPGAITGRDNKFAFKALSLFRESRGEPATSRSPAPKPDATPDTSGIDLNTAGPAFIDYTITDADLKNIGPIPSGVPAQAKLKFLPYRDATEAIAEEFHCGVRLLHELNPGKTKTIKPGDQLKVPNVEPFEFAAVKDLKPGSEMSSDAANDLPDESPAGDSQNTNQPVAPASPSMISVTIDTKTNTLEVYDANKLVAAYPVTIGSAQTSSPIGEWKVQRIVKLPRFRWDPEMLKHGTRSGHFHVLAPGPNSPVGVIWIALNKKGIGIHGTNEPETIGRAASHGCIRLANWDIVRFAQKVKPGVPVSIH
jgi:lipoprotein-anchoring transpeptidase ErfK/SrfK